MMCRERGEERGIEREGRRGGGEERMEREREGRGGRTYKNEGLSLA